MSRVVGPVTLMQAHEVLIRERPRKDAAPEKWLAYYRRSVLVYAEVAEVDRAHHHEAMYWAGRERRRANELTQRLAQTQ